MPSRQGAEASQWTPQPPVAGLAEAAPRRAALPRREPQLARPWAAGRPRGGRLGAPGRCGLGEVSAPGGGLGGGGMPPRCAAAARASGLRAYVRRSMAPRARHLEALPTVEALSQVGVRAAGSRRAAPPNWLAGTAAPLR